MCSVIQVANILCVDKHVTETFLYIHHNEANLHTYPPFVLPASLSGPSIPPGQQFMIDLLLNSLMVEQDLEHALVTAIAYEVQDPTVMLKEAGTESSVPLMQLVQQLLSNSTGRQLALLKQVL